MSSPRKSRRKPPKRTPVDEGHMLFRGGGASGDQPVKMEGDPLIICIDSRAIVDVARRAMLRKLRDQIYEGKRPDGGPQRPLSKQRQAERGRVSDHRGLKTGHFADELRSSPIKGTTAKASARILPPTDRNVFLAQEAKRGVHYLGFGPEVDAAIMVEVDAAIEDMLDGLRVVVEGGTPRAKDEG